MDLLAQNKALTLQVDTSNSEKAKLEEEIKRFEGESAKMVRCLREYKEKLIQCDKGLRELDSLERMYKEIKIQLDQYK